jgi:hypothetical protein
MGPLGIEQRPEVTRIGAAEHSDRVRPSLEPKFPCNHSEAVSAPYLRRDRSGVLAAQFLEALYPGYRQWFARADFSVKNARLSLEIENHTSHRFLRSMGRVPLQQACEDGKCEVVRA